MRKILAINPGSTSTKVAVYINEKAAFVETLSHDAETLAGFSSLYDQYQLRKGAIEQLVAAAGYAFSDLDAVVGRGGILRPLVGGVYRINQLMLEDCRQGTFGTHAANLGAVIAHEVGIEYGIPAFVVDPPVIDEFDDLARLSGLPRIPRKSMFHALNHKAIARRCAVELGLEYEQARLVVAHLGGGITVGAHELGRVVDVNNGYDAEGPMAPERAGTLPAGDLAKLCFSGEHSHDQVKRMLVGAGGIMAHLGTNDLREVKARIEAGNRQAELVYQAMAYQIAKSIGSYACVLSGQVDAIALTGGLVFDSEFTDLIRKRVEWIAPVKCYPGEDEMKSLALGTLRVLTGAETAKEYDENNIHGLLD
jgi:butyrate kinase